jgi:Holliday junction DNA helicase RuvA
MIAGLRGVIVGAEEAALVVDLHGFLVRVLSSAHTLANAGGPGDEVELKTHLVVREDALTLYGFLTQAELELFQLLLGVNGVGPRAALNLLSFAEPSALYQAIANDDVGLLSRAPGIGKVTAGRIVLDLKRKLPADIPVFLNAPDDKDLEAVAALESLGYTVAEARSALGGVDRRDGMTIEERVFAALQRMDRR